MHNCFGAADIMLPQKISMTKWACVACDQYSSELEYWQRVQSFVGDAPSTYHMIFPEALLRCGVGEERIQDNHRNMGAYMAKGLYRTFRRSYIYVERTLGSGKIRRGLVGTIDLEEYDFHPGSSAHIRATEGTVQERIPPRMELLRGAPMEFPHVLLLCDDKKDEILKLSKETVQEKLYDFDLMEHGGHISGYLISGLGVGIVNSAISNYISATEAQQPVGNAMSFAVGDGNHSLAAAKACWEEIKPRLNDEELLSHPARYALVELENIHDEAIEFEPIHRVLKGSNLGSLIETLQTASVADGFPVELLYGGHRETIYLDRTQSPLALGILQPILDKFVADTGVAIDYIHGEDVVERLSREKDTLGLIVPGMDKDALFPGVLQGGVLPRKTFSMGHANEKRYYLEGKRRV